MASFLTYFDSSWLPVLQKPPDWVFFILGFVAVGLLPVKERWADRVISVVLALLWAVTALTTRDLWWAILAGMEAVLFAVVGWMRLELPARSGSWAFAGTCLILYSLVAFPFLGGFLGLGPFKGVDFPLVLLTCGILFFGVSRTADFLLALPLLCVLFGSASLTSAGAVEIWGLRLALVAGAFFLALPPELRGGTDLRQRPGAAYRFAYKNRTIFGYGLWVLVVATLFLLFLCFAAEGRGPEQETGSWLTAFTINLTLLSALGIALWLAFPAWQSLWYRYAAWGMARAGGRVWAWSRENWRWGLLLLSLMIGLLSAIPSSNQQPEGATGNQQTASTVNSAAKNQKPASTVTKAEQPGWLSSFMSETRELLTNLMPPKQTLWLVAAIGLLWLLLEAYQGRRRLVIGNFDNNTGDETQKWIAGLGVQLQNELARIADLYQVIDEARPSRRSDVVQVVPGVEDVGAILKQAISTALGTATAGFAAKIADIFTRLVSGPQLKGAVHKIGDDYVITSDLSGGGLALSWRVDTKALSEEEKSFDTKDVPRALIEQLAFRIATDLVSIGSPRWRAVRCFTRGLRFYRDTQRQNDKEAKLREAERCLIRALNDDQRFTQCHYNLGVVYRQLCELGSAESAFRRVLRDSPDQFEACYALAETLVQAKKFGDAVRFCEAAIGIDADDARAWDLGAYSLRSRQQELENFKVTLPPDHPAWTEICAKSEIAVALAWRSLCRQTLQGPQAAVQRELTTALLCTRNLAVVLTRAERYRDSMRLFRQAASLAPHDPGLRVFEGRTLFWTRRWEGAEAALEGTFDEGLEADDRGLLWSTLAQVHARSGPEPARRDSVRLAHQRFLDLAAGASPEELSKFMDFSLEAPPQEQHS